MPRPLPVTIAAAVRPRPQIVTAVRCCFFATAPATSTVLSVARQRCSDRERAQLSPALTTRSLATRAEGASALTRRHLCRGLATRATPHAGTEAVPFARSQQTAREDFERWWRENSPSLKVPRVERVDSMLVPFWAFIARVSVPSLALNRTVDDSPHLQIYAGAAFPRVFMEVAKQDLLNARPFSAGLLQVPGGGAVELEPFVLYEATAWQLARQQLLEHEAAVHGRPPAALGDASFSGVESHRVLFPVHGVIYTYLFTEFRVIVNGRTGAAYGVQQTAAFTGVPLSSVLERAAQLQPLLYTLRRMRLPEGMVQVVIGFLSVLIRPALKLIFWPPFFLASLAAVGAWTAARTTAGLREQHLTFARWQEQREAEAKLQATMSDDWNFRPVGESRADRARARAREAEEARSQQQEQQRQRAEAESRARASSSYSSSRRPASDGGRSTTRPSAASARSSGGGRPPPPVDSNDYYAVLGLSRRSASEDDVKAAFRRELMLYHPDHAPAAGLDPAACSERTRQIIKAYGTLRDAGKRREYDRGYRGRAV
jgi:hypothetical protein